MFNAFLLLLSTREFVLGFDFNVMIMNSMGFDATAPLGKDTFPSAFNSFSVDLVMEGLS